MRTTPLVFTLRGSELICPPYRILPTRHGYDVHYDGPRSYGILARAVATESDATAICEKHREGRGQ